MPERAPRLVSFAAALVNCAAPLVNFAARRPGSGGWALGAEGARAAAAGGEAGRAAWGSAAGSSLRAPPPLLLLLPPARLLGAQSLAAPVGEMVESSSSRLPWSPRNTVHSEL